MRDQTLHHRDTDCQLVGSYEKLTAKLEGTRRVQTHAILLYPNPIDLWPFNPRTMSQSLLGYLKITPYAKFEHCFRFSVMLRLLVWKMHVLTQWPFNPKIMSLLGYPKVNPYTKFEYFGIIHFELCFGQTDNLEYPTNAESLWVTSEIQLHKTHTTNQRKY